MVFFTKPIVAALLALLSLGLVGCQEGDATSTESGANIQNVIISSHDSLSRIGEQAQLKAVASYDDGSNSDVTAKVIWESENIEIISIDNKGFAVANNEGTTKLSASLDSFQSNKLAFTVSKPEPKLSSVSISANSSSMIVGESLQLRALAVYSDGSKDDVTSEVSWMSKNVDVVEVDFKGVAKGAGVGLAEISVSYGGIQSNTFSVEIAPIFLLSVLFEKVKTLSFSWNFSEGYEVHHYELYENTDGLSGFSSIATVASTSSQFDHYVALFDKVNASYYIKACSDSECTDHWSSNIISVRPSISRSIGY